MKTNLVILIFSISPLFITAQSAILGSPSLGSGVKSSLEMSIGKGDVTAILEFMADKVELTIEGEQEMLMKKEAAQRLEEFYTAHPARGFIPTASNEARTEQAGVLTTETDDFQVSLQFTKKASKRLITGMQIGVKDSNVQL